MISGTSQTSSLGYDSPLYDTNNFFDASTYIENVSKAAVFFYPQCFCGHETMQILAYFADQAPSKQAHYPGIQVIQGPNF